MNTATLPLTTPMTDLYRPLQRGVWVYFALLILEGALRKWLLPGLATPLLIVRDPVALWVIWQAWQRGVFPATRYVPAIILIAFASFVMTLLFGHGNVFVALFGLRILVIHLPFMFVMGAIFSRADVLQIGRILLWATVPMAILISLQFSSPQSAWVNRGVGGDLAGAGFSGAMGYMRPPGTFSFTNGTTQFFSLVGVFVIYFWMVHHEKINRLLLLAATGALLVAIPLSISRGLLFQVLLTGVFAGLFVARRPQFLGRIVLAGVGIVGMFIVVSKLGIFGTATEVFTARLDMANKAEGGLEGVLLDRYLGGLLNALLSSEQQPIFGHGLGMGTNVGSQMLTGSRQFLIDEGEWGRLVGEMGALLGVLIILIRLGISLELALQAYQRLRVGDLLPWLLLSYVLTLLPQGQWSQPTSLGFCTFVTGLLMAALWNRGQAPYSTSS